MTPVLFRAALVLGFLFGLFWIAYNLARRFGWWV